MSKMDLATILTRVRSLCEDIDELEASVCDDPVMHPDFSADDREYLTEARASMTDVLNTLEAIT